MSNVVTAQQYAHTGGLFVKPTRMKPLYENFALRPGLNADRDAIAASTTVQQSLADKNAHFEVLGTNATSALVTHSTTGGLLLTTAGASADQIIILPHLNTGVSAWTGTTWSTSKEVAWSCQIVTGASVADTTIWAGLKLTNTSVLATDNDQAFFRVGAGHATYPGKILFCYSVGGTDYELDTGVTAAASTNYVLCVVVDENRLPVGLIGEAGSRPVVKAKGVNAMTASTGLKPYVGLQADTGAAKTMDLKWEEIAQNY